MKKLILLNFILLLVSAGTTVAFSEEESSVPLYTELGQLSVQYPTSTCGMKNIVIIAKIEYVGEDKRARVEGFVPKINARLFLSLSDYMASHGGKKIDNRDIQKIVQETADDILGAGYIDEALIMNVLTQ